MKVTLDKNEIQEAVQHYISNVLGSSLLVSEIAVIQGRESNGARIEIDLFKAEPIDLDNGEIIDSVTFEIKGILDTNFEKLILNTCSFSELNNIPTVFSWTSFTAIDASEFFDTIVSPSLTAFTASAS